MATVLLIGASRGIGLEMARQYRQDGWRVIGTARDDAGLARLRALDCEALRVDVADPASNSGLAWQLDGEKLDVAIYVAGVIDRADTTTPPTRETFDRLMHTNVMGAAMALPQTAPMLQEAGGVFAVISSVMGSLAQTQSGGSALYRISKAALNMWMRCAQFDHPKLCCVAFHPGWVQTDMGGAQAPLTPVQSAADLRQTLERVRAHRAQYQGAFLNHDGSPLPW
ncbi:MAG: SDR family oxidoreductase [Burkholderiaceae bacterium]|jgi:NAD(P)-dependent dehydrogenase (short-subunit alcohol dehydrogenase family)|nr:SDR family oxidoreductase [Burkholderiaceae bacterium]